MAAWRLALTPDRVLLLGTVQGGNLAELRPENCFGGQDVSQRGKTSAPLHLPTEAMVKEHSA